MKDAETGLDIRTTQETVNPARYFPVEPVARRFEATYTDNGYTFTVWVEHERDDRDELASYSQLRERAIAGVEAAAELYA